MLVLFGEGIFHTFVLRRRRLREKLAHTVTVLQLRLDEGREHGRLEGLRHIGVGTHVEAFHLVVGCDFRRDEDHGDMTELDVLLDLLTELIAVLSWHRHVADHDVRLGSTHLFEGGVGIKAGDEAVVLREEHPHVVDHLRIVVNDEECRTLVFLFVNHLHGRGLHRQGGIRSEGGVCSQGTTLFLRIGLLSHRIDEGKDGTGAILAVACHEGAVVQFGQSSGVVESDARTPVDDALRLVVELVVALEDILQLVLWQSLARIGDSDLDLIVSHVEAHVDVSASGCELQGVRDEVCENLLQLVAIRPRHECVLHAEAVDGDGSLLGVVDEVVAHAVDHLHHVELFDAQPQCVVLELVEVHQLVHELEHPLDIAVGDGEQVLVVAAEAFALHDLAHRPCDHRQRRTELVGDVGEETHVHLVCALLLLLLHLRLTGSTTGRHHATGIAVEIVGEGSGEGEVDAPCPPGVGGSRVYGHAQGTLASDGFVAGGVGGFHAEGVASCGQVGIAGSMGVAGIDPVAVETVHLIIVMYTFVLAEVEGGEREAEAVLVVSKAYLLATVEQGVDGAVSSRAHQLVVDLQVAEPDGQLP